MDINELKNFQKVSANWMEKHLQAVAWRKHSRKIERWGGMRFLEGKISERIEQRPEKDRLFLPNQSGVIQKRWPCPKRTGHSAKQTLRMEIDLWGEASVIRYF
jgi:hypothetical protein